MSALFSHCFGSKQNERLPELEKLVKTLAGLTATERQRQREVWHNIAPFLVIYVASFVCELNGERPDSSVGCLLTKAQETFLCLYMFICVASHGFLPSKKVINRLEMFSKKAVSELLIPPGAQSNLLVDSLDMLSVALSHKRAITDGLAKMIANYAANIRAWNVPEEIVSAYRQGSGVPYSSYAKMSAKTVKQTLATFNRCREIDLTVEALYQKKYGMNNNHAEEVALQIAQTRRTLESNTTEENVKWTAYVFFGLILRCVNGSNVHPTCRFWGHLTRPKSF